MFREASLYFALVSQAAQCSEKLAYILQVFHKLDNVQRLKDECVAMFWVWEEKRAACPFCLLAFPLVRVRCKTGCFDFFTNWWTIIWRPEIKFVVCFEIFKIGQMFKIHVGVSEWLWVSCVVPPAPPLPSTCLLSISSPWFATLAIDAKLRFRFDI